jgi:hypothetical protein
MKKLQLSFIALTMMSLVASAQNTRFGISTGVAIANYKAKVDGASENGNSKTGITFGIISDLPLSKHFSIQPALNFVQKGTKDEETFGGITEKVSLTTNHLEIPVNFLYNTHSGNGNFFFGAGPSFAFGMSGKWKYNDGTDQLDESVSFGNGDEDDLKGFDFGANILAGYTLPNGLTFSVNYNAGISNLYPGGESNASLRSNYFGIKIGWFFKKGGKK